MLRARGSVGSFPAEISAAVAMATMAALSPENCFSGKWAVGNFLLAMRLSSSLADTPPAKTTEATSGFWLRARLSLSNRMLMAVCWKLAAKSAIWDWVRRFFNS